MNSLFRIMTRFFMFLALAAIHYVVWWDDSWYSRVDHGWAMDPSRPAFEHHWMRALSWLQRHLGREISDIFGPHWWQCYQNWADTIGSLPWKACQLHVARNHLRPVQGLEQYRRCTPHRMVNELMIKYLGSVSYYCIPAVERPDEFAFLGFFRSRARGLPDFLGFSMGSRSTWSRLEIWTLSPGAKPRPCYETDPRNSMKAMESSRCDRVWPDRW